jgi:hypothetical protein
LTDGTTPRVDWAVVCDYALVDGAGKISLLGIFERLFAANFPAMHPVMYFAAQWVGAPFSTIEVELRIWGPSKEMIGTATQHIELAENGRSGAVIQLSPVPLPAPGEYVFELLGGGTSQKHVSISVESPPTQ